MEADLAGVAGRKAQHPALGIEQHTGSNQWL
jgi:hypothetical protein